MEVDSDIKSTESRVSMPIDASGDSSSSQVEVVLSLSLSLSCDLFVS